MRWSLTGYTGSRWTSGLALGAFRSKAKGRIGGGVMLLWYFMNPSWYNALPCSACTQTQKTCFTDHSQQLCGWKLLWLTSRLATILILLNLEWPVSLLSPFELGSLSTSCLIHLGRCEDSRCTQVQAKREILGGLWRGHNPTLIWPDYKVCSANTFSP